MVALEFIGYSKSYLLASYLGVEDFADKANFLWNVVVLLICMAVVTTRSYFMDPIVCYIPTKFDGENAAGYMTSLCWVEGTYTYNLSNSIPIDDAGRQKFLDNNVQLNYYQWVPFVLALQAIMYYMPRLFWQMLTYNRTGTDLQNLVQLASDASQQTGETREKSVENITANLEQMFYCRRNFRTGVFSRLHLRCPFFPGKRQGNNLLFFYIVVKISYAVIGMLELYIMFIFLRMDKSFSFWNFGQQVLTDILNGHTWHETNVFPRRGICLQQFRHIANINVMFAQCVLPVNMLNEKVYIFLYFYLTFVLGLTLLSIPLWIYRTAFSSRQTHFIRRFLKMANSYERDSGDKGYVKAFVHEFLRQDGHFLLRMLSMNAGDLITTDIVARLFVIYKKKYTDCDLRRPAVEHDVVQSCDGNTALLLRRNVPGAGGKEVDDNFVVKLQSGGVTGRRTAPSAPGTVDEVDGHDMEKLSYGFKADLV